jgi:acyl-CoA reductase-like NAD-dependent aldehyde dehydrogenase
MKEKMDTPDISQAVKLQPQPILVAGSPWQTEAIAEVKNPWDGSVVAIVSQATQANAEAALSAAEVSFRETRALSSWQRADILHRIADLIAADSVLFAKLIVLEAGKTIRDARAEVARAIQTFKVAAEEAKRIEGKILPLDWTPGAEGRIAMTQSFPVGPILGICPFNFPLNLVAHKLAPAIASGNPIIIKPSPFTPLTAIHLGLLAIQAGWPKGALSVLPCKDDIADCLLRDDRIRKLSFTGSAAIGWELKAAVPRKHVTLELGGNAAVIVHEDADVKLAAQRILQGGFTYSGQSCISVQRIFAHESIVSELMKLVAGGLRELVSGDPFDESTQLGPMISESAATRAHLWVQQAVEAGAQLVEGGNRVGRYLDPTLLADVPATTKLACEEVFAPVAYIHTYSRFSQALATINESRYGLQAAVFTQNWSLIAEAWSTLEVGAVIVNDSPAWRVEHMPYGGTKDSGAGREGVRSAIEAMTESRLLVISR